MVPKELLLFPSRLDQQIVFRMYVLNSITVIILRKKVLKFSILIEKQKMKQKMKLNP